MSKSTHKPKLQDVAKRANVSPATVSRVLHNNAPVRESVRARVLSSLNELGYTQTASRYSTANKLRYTVAIVIADILNPFFTEIVRGINTEAGDHIIPILLDTAEDPVREQQVWNSLATGQVDGVIVCASRLDNDTLIANTLRLKTPIVVINRSIANPNIPCITIDFNNGAYRAARHLIELHHTRIAYLAGPIHSGSSQTRLQGIESALSEAGLALYPELCVSSFPNVDGAFHAMSALLALPEKDRPTGVIAYNDVMAMGVLHAIRAHHLRVPEDISVVGFDNINIAEHTNPPLTTVSQPKQHMGKLAMQILRQMMRGEKTFGEGYMLVESPLIVRESAAPHNSGVKTS